MDDVVAEVRQQHRVVIVHGEHVAQRVGDALQHADLLAVGNDLRGRVRGDGEALRIWKFGQQGLGQGDLGQQVGLAHGVLGGGQDRQRQQVDRVDVGGGVDADVDALGQCIDGVGQPGRLVFLAQRVAVPVRGVFGQHGAEPDRFAEVHHHLAVVGAQHLGDAPQQRPDRLLLLGLASQFVQVAVALHQPFVADVHRLEQHRAGGLAQVGAHGHGDHAALGLQQPAGARAPAFDEVLQRIAARHQLGYVFGEHRRIQRVAAEAAAHEERPALAQDGAHHRQVEVDAGGDVRRHDAAFVQQVGQQQVVHVAAVAGHVDHFVARRHFLELVQVVDQHAAVDLVPHRGEDEAGRAHHRVRIVRGDLPGVGMGLLPGLHRLGVVAPGLVGDGLAHGVGGQHLVHQQAPGGQVRADHRGTDLAEVRAQHALQLAHGALRLQAFLHARAQGHRLGEADQGVATVEQDRQHPPEAADQGPVFREQHREPAAAPVRGAADEDRHRHQAHVQRRVGAVGLQQLGQRVGVGTRRRALVGDQGRGVAARQGHVGALAPGRVARQRHQRRGQAGLAAGLVQDQGVGQAVVLQHVADRARVGGVLVQVGRFQFQVQPGIGQPTQQARPQRAPGEWRGPRSGQGLGHGAGHVLGGLLPGDGRRPLDRSAATGGRCIHRRGGRTGVVGPGRRLRERQGVLFRHGGIIAQRRARPWPAAVAPGRAPATRAQARGAGAGPGPVRAPALHAAGRRRVRGSRPGTSGRRAGSG